MIACCARRVRCPSAEELAGLPHGELAGRLSEVYRVIAVLTAQSQGLAARAVELAAQGEELSAQVTALRAQFEELGRRAGRDSSSSSRPPSSDDPYKGAAAFLGEHVTPAMIGGGLLILAGMAVATAS